ncbi:PilT/PilU family type 4a pilus ATPase [Patescibacteria group bacterium]|nr:PilT/PilU family type 4a pilus ATPase [Patescibacteria group bacterium]
MNYQEQLERFLEIVIEKQASDLHISVGHPPILRIAQNLVYLEQEKKITQEVAQGLAFCLIGNKRTEKFLREKEIDIAYNFKEKMRFRANVYFASNYINIALRAISQKIRTIEELGLPFILNKLTEASQGLVLITGASSQGKSTTLAALIDQINHTRTEHIITIEDPIEYIFKDDKSLVDQREVYSDTLSFAKALRSALRQDPDVVMVGEMRDLETISTALTAAETGHLVFATLHTNSAHQTIHRIIDVFSSQHQDQIRAQLSGSLLAVVSQRLITTIDKNIIPVCEIMFNNSAVSNLIRENKIHEIPTVIETSRDQGMVVFNSALVDLVKQGLIEEGTALRYSFNPKDLEARLKRI